MNIWYPFRKKVNAAPTRCPTFEEEIAKTRRALDPVIESMRQDLRAYATAVQAQHEKLVREREELLRAPKNLPFTIHETPRGPLLTLEERTQLKFKESGFLKYEDFRDRERTTIAFYYLASLDVICTGEPWELTWGEVKVPDQIMHKYRQDSRVIGYMISHEAASRPYDDSAGVAAFTTVTSEALADELKKCPVLKGGESAYLVLETVTKRTIRIDISPSQADEIYEKLLEVWQRSASSASLRP